MNSDIVIVISSLPEEGKTGNEFRVEVVDESKFNEAIVSKDTKFFIENMDSPNYTKKISKAMTVAAAICKNKNINTIKLVSVSEIFPRPVYAVETTEETK